MCKSIVLSFFYFLIEGSSHPRKKVHCAITTLETRQREPQTGSRLITLIQYGTKAQRQSLLLVIANYSVFRLPNDETWRAQELHDYHPHRAIGDFLLAFDLEAVTLLL
jgi:hypothetical protein